MQDRPKAADVKASVDITEVIGRYVNLSRQGTEHVGVCPFHDDRRASLKVNRNKQIFCCFACDTKGDVLDFVSLYERVDLPQAIDIILGNNMGGGSPIRQLIAKGPKKPDIKVIRPLKAATMADFRHKYLGEPSRHWEYRDGDGNLIYYTCRFDTPQGKEVLPLSFTQCEGRLEWRWIGQPTPRPIYGLNRLAANPTATVVIVEGEKCADAAQRLLPKAAVISWPGGSKAIDKIDWWPLNGRKVLLWPDNHTEDRYGDKHPKAGQLKPWHEQDGNACMLRVAEQALKAGATWVKWIHNPDGAPHKWDSADAEADGWTPEQTSEFVRENVTPVPSPEAHSEVVPDEAPPPPPMEAPLPTDEPPAPADDEPEPPVPRPAAEPTEEPAPFRMLGYEKAETGQLSYYFYVNGSQKVLRFSASSLASTANLMTLAPLNYWELHYPGKRASVDVNAAVNALIQRSQRIGIFRERFIRGRGAWMDEGRVVVHSGDRLIVDGSGTPLEELRTRYIYELSEALDIGYGQAVGPKDGIKLLEMARLLNWERDINAYLLAGWCVIAPVCGALRWRPHIWITGAAGTGKSWVFQKLVRPILGNTVLAVQGETSEAGLRQTLGHDALPVVFDEAEGEDRKAAERMQQVLALVRAASTEDGGTMAKGSATGQAKSYRIRSCFAFASIGVQIEKAADRGRVTVLGLRKALDPGAATRWQQLQRMYAETMTPEFIAGLQARTLQLLPTILRNAEMFSAAVVAVLEEQRAGDQLGALLAGAYALHTSKVVTYDEAVAWVKARDWSDQRPSDDQRDEWRLFQTLMEEMVRVDTVKGVVTRTIGELAQIAARLVPLDDFVSTELASQMLKRIGFKIEDANETDRWLYVSNTTKGVLKILHDTRWSKNHNKTLMRLPGAEAVGSTRFASGIQSRAVRLPMELFR